MKIASILEMIEWSKTTHASLAHCLLACAKESSDPRTQGLLEYLGKHETRMQNMIEGFEKQADLKALNTLVYDYEVHTPVKADDFCEKKFSTMSYQEISSEVFSIHNKIIDLYKSLLGRAAIPEEQQLLQALLDVEEHETRQMAHQVNRGLDM